MGRLTEEEMPWSLVEHNNLRVSNIRVSKRALIYNVCSKSALT